VDVQADLESLFSRFNAQQRGQSDEESQPPLRRRLSFTEQMEQKLVEMLVADNKSASGGGNGRNKIIKMVAKEVKINKSQTLQTN
jgi:hypothetical protein